jgi:hypothetical protein
MAASTQSTPMSSATRARDCPTHRTWSRFETEAIRLPSGVARRHQFSQRVGGPVISARIRARASGSARFR